MGNQCPGLQVILGAKSIKKLWTMRWAKYFNQIWSISSLASSFQSNFNFNGYWDMVGSFGKSSEIIRVFSSQLNWVFNTQYFLIGSKITENYCHWHLLWLVLNWTFREFDIFSSFSSPRWLCPDYLRTPSCSWSLSSSRRRPCRHSPWSWLRSQHKVPAKK